MSFFIGAPNVLRGEMSVDLGGGDIGVPQQLLHGSQVSPAAQHVGGKAVPEGVGADLGIQARRAGVFLQFLPETLPGEPVTAGVEEKG